MRLHRGLMRLVASIGYRAVRGLWPHARTRRTALISVHNHDFMRDKAFLRAYARGVRALGGASD